MKKTYQRPVVQTIEAAGELLESMSMPKEKKDNVVVGSRRADYDARKVDPWQKWDDEGDDD